LGECFKYQVFGINILSSFPISDLVPSRFNKPDLTIREGRVPETMENYADKGTFYFAAPGRFLFGMDAIGRFWAQDGKEIVVEKCKGVHEKELNLFLLGSVMGAAILQRGLTPVHGCAVLKEGSATIITGRSGAGKSSLAADYMKEGYHLVSDDISVIDTKNDIPVVKRGIQHLKLWEDAMRSLDFETRNAEKVRPELNKYRKSFKTASAPDDSVLHYIISLDVKNSKGFTINELHGIEKFNHVRQNIYRGVYIEPLGVSENIFRTISSLLDKVKVFQVARPISPLNIQELRLFIQENIPQNKPFQG
jgi:hypothetical protein